MLLARKLLAVTSEKLSLFPDNTIKKLNTLKDEIATLCDMKEGCSSYSNEMIKNIIDIIDCLIKNNSLSYWRDQKNRNNLLELFAVIDHEKGTFVPEVFNTQSYTLARKILAFIENLDLEKDIHPYALKALETYSNPTAIKATLIENLKYRIGLYEMFVNNQDDSKKLNAYCADFDSFFDDLGKRVNNFAPKGEALTEQKKTSTLKNLCLFKIADEQITTTGLPIKILQDLSEIYTPECYKILKNTYQTRCNELITELNKLPYVRICNADGFVNNDTPNHLSSDDLHARGNRGQAIWYLIAAELAFNQQLIEKNYPPLTMLYDYFKQTYSPELTAKKEQYFQTLVKNLIHELNDYETGKHLKLWKKVDSEKAACVKQLRKDITDENNTLPIGVHAFDTFKRLLDAINKNEKICTHKSIALGELSKLLNSHAAKFFNFSFYEVDQTCDAGVSRRLKDYEDKLSLNKQPENENTMQPSLRM